MERIKQFESPMEAETYSCFVDCYLKPEIQHKIGKYYADFAFVDKKIVVEYDGKEFHQNKEYDDERDSYMISKGWDVFRITTARNLYEQVKEIANYIRKLEGKLPFDPEDENGLAYYINENGEKMYS